MTDFAYFQILGKPLIFYFGIITLTSFFLTAFVGYLNFKGYRRVSLRWHLYLAIISLSLGVIHALMGILTYL
ncbi:hypothetical protein A2Z22_04705 [Candidatus Woesebacteria bacterium RBG_16_34_12]|uniref:DUF420 domain-containing protein n=1 Tax=Candidatus Woesebacteria bacterium RBG_16_34_12 TaxID=1802480 RepID=A0A1F7XAB5_9BACT|nr:MAG: hypothetical protein A2Z22_04705 [Candidatus Woesebacteria bacterium RBG_16_34_12]